MSWRAEPDPQFRREAKRRMEEAHKQCHGNGGMSNKPPSGDGGCLLAPLLAVLAMVAIPKQTARQFALSKPPEETTPAPVEPTLHPSISPTVVHHLRAHGYLVLVPEDLAASIQQAIAATPSKDRTPNKLAAVVMRLLRRESGHG